jgi:hypothetical protein
VKMFSTCGAYAKKEAPATTFILAMKQGLKAGSLRH